MTIESLTDGDVFLAFLEQVLASKLQPGHVAVLDNPGAHKVPDVRPLIESRGGAAAVSAAVFARLQPHRAGLVQAETTAAGGQGASRRAQLGQEAFEPGIDRGHLTRREDAAWGVNKSDALRSNNDTFHFTNCSLQASPFNCGKDRWQGLEQFLLEQHAKKDKRLMVVITGPVFAANDPVYRNDKMDYSVRCPIQFWKVCVLIREDDSPSATAFILGQEDIRDLPGFEEAFDVAATQIRVADLEKKTGLDFGTLKQYEHFAQGGDAGTLELEGGATRLKPIRMGSGIIRLVRFRMRDLRVEAA